TAVYYQGKALNIYQELKKYESAAIASVSLADMYNKREDYRKAYQLMTEQFQAPYIYTMPNILSTSYGTVASILSNAKNEVPEINQIPNRDSVINMYLDSCILLEEKMGTPVSLIQAWGSYS